MEKKNWMQGKFEKWQNKPYAGEMRMSGKKVKKAECRQNAHEWQNGKKKLDAGEMHMSGKMVKK